MITVQPLNCTLKRHEGEDSSTDRMIEVIGEAFDANGATMAPTIRVAAHNVLPGVTSDEGEGDEWPGIRKAVLAADIVLLATPIWLGQPGSVAKRVVERMDAFLSETDDAGRMPSYSKLACVAVVGNEDGAHATAAAMFQALNDVGFTIPPVGSCYWVGEAMHATDFKDLRQVPDKVTQTAKMLADNACHLAALLKGSPYPGHE